MKIKHPHSIMNGIGPLWKIFVEYHLAKSHIPFKPEWNFLVFIPQIDIPVLVLKDINARIFLQNCLKYNILKLDAQYIGFVT